MLLEVIDTLILTRQAHEHLPRLDFRFYTVHEELTVEGKPVTFDAADSSTWVRRDGKWVCTLHTESLLGDPFGRDRKKTKKA